eukprot:gene20144-22117_t
MITTKNLGIVAGICSVGFFGYCIYFDHKRRSDPEFKKKLKKRREEQKKQQKENSESLKGLPNLKDQDAVQKFFMEEVQLGEDLLAQGDYENCVKHLTNAIAVCGQPQQLLQVFQGMLPPPVFQMLLQNLATIGSSPQLHLLDMRTRCPQHLNVSWVDLPPYIYNNSKGEVGGVFYEVLKDMTKFCCNDATSINYMPPIDGIGKLQDIVYNSSGDVFVPFYGSNKKKFVLGQPFISLVDSPGIAFFYGKESSAQAALVESFFSSWPVLVVILLSALVAGTLFWIMELVNDSRSRQKQDKTSKESGDKAKSFLFKVVSGPCDGFYWAIVTLTTVGYGDYSPKSVPGRFLAMLWILFGTIILSMFTASITTGLITACLSNEISLAGATVAVLQNSKESYIATKKNAIAVGTSNLEELSNFLSRGKTDGVLIDSYIAGHYQKQFEKYLLADIIEYVFTYGLVLSNKGMWLEKCFRIYPEIYRDVLFRKLSSSIIPFKPTKFGNQASAKSSSIVSVNSNPIKYFFVGVSMLIILLVLSGLLKARFLKKDARRKKKGHFNADTSSCFDHNTRAERHRHLQETCKTVQQIRDEMDNFNTSLDKMISSAIRERDNWNNLNNGNETVEHFSRSNFNGPL